MPTVYARRFDLKASLTDSEVAAFWKYAVEEFVPACLKPAKGAARLYGYHSQSLPLAATD